MGYNRSQPSPFTLFPTPHRADPHLSLPLCTLAQAQTRDAEAWQQQAAAHIEANAHLYPDWPNGCDEEAAEDAVLDAQVTVHLPSFPPPRLRSTRRQ